MKFRRVSRQTGAAKAATSTSRRKASSFKSLERTKKKKKDEDGISKSSSKGSKTSSSKRKRETDGTFVIQRPAGKRRTSIFVGSGSRSNRRNHREEGEEGNIDEERTAALSPASSVGSSVSSMTPLTTVTNKEQKKRAAEQFHRANVSKKNEYTATPPPPSTVKVRFAEGSESVPSPQTAMSPPPPETSSTPEPTQATLHADHQQQHQDQDSESEKQDSTVALLPTTEISDWTFEYPGDDDVDFPSSSTLRQLHDHHISPYRTGEHDQESQPSETREEMVTLTIPADATDDNSRSHQLSLTLRSSKLLSLEDVIIPAVAYTEKIALKNLHSKALSSLQQHQLAPDGHLSLARLKLVKLAPVALSRMAIQECALAACLAARQSRLSRDAQRHAQAVATKQRRDDQRAQRRKLEAERRRQEQERQHLQARHLRRIQLRKTLPKNKRAQKEIVHLFTQLGHMEKAERVWTQTLARVEADTQKRKKDAQQVIDDIRASSPIKPQSEEVGLDNGNKNLDFLLDSLVVALERIESSLQHVSDVVIPQSDSVRTELYQTYTQQHKFQGYRNRLGGRGANQSAATLFKRALRDIESDDTTDSLSVPMVVSQEDEDDKQNVSNPVLELGLG